MLNRLVMAMVLAGLAGCAAVGPNFLNPEPGNTVAGNYRHATALAGNASATKSNAVSATDSAALSAHAAKTSGQGAASSLPAQWWTVFADPVLNGLQQQALANNPGVKAAAERLLQARAQLGISRANDGPQVNLGASVANSRTSAATSQGHALGGHAISGNQYSVGSSMAYEVDVWGKLRRINEAAAAQVEVASLDRDGVLLVLTSQVANTYWQWRGVNAEMAILQQSLASRQQSQQLVESRFAGGIGNELDVSRARLESANAQADLAEVERQRNTLEHLLAVLVGSSPSQALAALQAGAAVATGGAPVPGVATPDVATPDTSPVSSADGLNEPPAIPAGLPAQLLAQRPDLAQSVAQLRALNAQIGVAQSAFYPSLSLTGNFGFASQDLRDLAQGGSRQFSLGPLALSLPIFDGGRNQANLELAQSRYREALENHQTRLLNALREVEDALSDTEQKQKQGVLQVQAQQAALRAYAVAFARYEHGVSNYLDVTDAQRSALAAQRAAVQIRTQRYLAATAVARALGGGWQPKA